MPEIKKLKDEIHSLRLDKYYMQNIIRDIVSGMPKEDDVIAVRLLMLADMKPSSFTCLMCNRPLKSASSIRLGMGPSCHKKHIQGLQVPLKLVAA
ncbi:hypothetical protein KAR91_49345 [Candidatus Pacearchaeota archaeon]|nr:hypothetical protein [Candidatus Pacearchaeota archaeon]